MTLNEIRKSDPFATILISFYLILTLCLLVFAALALPTISETEQTGVVLNISNYNAKQEVCLRIGEICKIIQIDYEMYSQIKEGDKIKVKKTEKRFHTFYEIITKTSPVK